MQALSIAIVLVLLATWFGIVPAQAALCSPPSGLVDLPLPTLAPDDQLVARVEEIVIDRPIDHVIAVGERSNLEDVVARGSSLPSVSGTYPLTSGPFGAPNSRRLVCLTDGSTLLEQVLVNWREERQRRFRYVVWNYSSPQARPIQYGVGHFVHTDLGDGRTQVRWTYAFLLRRDRFPGKLGPIGDWLFRISFLDRDYAKMMQGTLKGMKAQAEAS